MNRVNDSLFNEYVVSKEIMDTIGPYKASILEQVEEARTRKVGEHVVLIGDDEDGAKSVNFLAYDKFDEFMRMRFADVLPLLEHIKKTISLPKQIWIIVSKSDLGLMAFQVPEAAL